jgi:hypothetical protein
MALDRLNRPGFEDKRGVHFAMKHVHKTVRVFVARAAIKGAASTGDLMPEFEANRSFYEFLASEMFDPTRPLVRLVITPNDLLGKTQTVRLG